MKTIASLVLLGLFVFAPSAFAQQEKGDIELEFAGSLITRVGAEEASGVGIIQSKIGRFVTDRLELGAYPSLELQIDGGETDARIGAGLFAVYSFLMVDAMTVPYTGLFYYKSDVAAGFDARDNWLGVNGGLKVYFAPNAALDVGVNYLFSLHGKEGGLLIMQAGISFLL